MQNLFGCIGLFTLLIGKLHHKYYIVFFFSSKRLDLVASSFVTINACDVRGW